MTARGFGYLEFWVADAGRAATRFCEGFGFTVTARAGPDTGFTAGGTSFVVEQGDVAIVFTDAGDPASAVARFVVDHGDGVRDIALAVDDVDATYGRAVAAGAAPARAPEGGPGARRATVGAFGDVVHSLVGAGDVLASLPSGYEPVGDHADSVSPVGIVGLDHCALSVEPGRRPYWVDRYQEALGFERVPGDQHIDVDGSAFVMSTVRVVGGEAALVLAEPADESGNSQIGDFLTHFGGPGVHHVALATADIAGTVRRLHDRGVEMLAVPASYAASADARVGRLDLGMDWRELAELGVVVDSDDDGHLLQAFTPPLGDRPTTSLEIIQREGMRGFGARNVRDLYAEVVREQGRRAVSD